MPRRLALVLAPATALILFASAAFAGVEPPTISATVTPAPNAGGWNNTVPVTVGFDCADDDVVVSCTAPVEVLTEGAAQNIAGTVEDNDANVVGTSVDVNIDVTDPEITGTIVETPNDNGWFDGPVTIEWTCSDALSGIASCPGDTVIDTDGAGQSATGETADLAGNTAGATVEGINIDLDAPTITASRDVQPNAFGWNRTDVTVTWICTDDQPGATLSEETFTFSTEGASLSHSVTCTDLAGNTASNVQTASVDKTAPMTTIDRFTGGDVTGGATDNLSGVTGTKVTWTNIGTIQTQAVCYSGCVSTVAKWRATPPRPWPGIYRIGARSTDLAGNEGPSATAAPIIDIVP